MPKQFRCAVCGHIHDGDSPPDSCPVCGVGAEFFEPLIAPEETAPAPAATDHQATPTAVPNEMPSGPRWVIVGGGAAAFFAADRARASNAEAQITLVHRESYLPYDRMSLTRLLAGEVLRERLGLADAQWFAQRRVVTVRAEARSLDRQRRVVVLHDGQELPYDRLLLAQGAHAFVPPMAGVRRDGVHVLRTLSDAESVLARANPASRCVVIGGGLLGLEIAGALARRRVQVTVLEEAPWLLPRQLAQSAAERLRDYLSGLGVSLHAGVKVAEIKGDETVRSVLLVDGRELPADVLVIAAGVRPNVEMARAAGLTVRRGVVVDDELRTDDPNIWAAGDVAEHQGMMWGQWSVSVEQGMLAGRSLAGQAVRYEGKPPAASLKVLDWPVFSIGRVEATADGTVRERGDATRFLRVVLEGDTVVGGCLLGQRLQDGRDVEGPALMAALRRAVDERRPLAAEPELRAALETP